MEITSLEQAIEIVETQKYDVPFEAIEYLYNCNDSATIVDKFCYWLDNAEIEEVCCTEEGVWLNAPLWFTVAVENHLSERLVMPICMYFTNPENDCPFDYLNEELIRLVFLLSQKFGEPVAKKFFEAAHTAEMQRLDCNYFFLLDNSACFIEDKAYLIAKIREVLRIELDCGLLWGLIITEQNLVSLVPDIQELVEKMDKKGLDTSELEETLDILANKDRSNSGHVCSEEEIKDWVARLELASPDFEYEELDLPSFSIPERKPAPKMIAVTAKKDKIGRNDPCPCGSGKKYKKCCGK